MTIFPTAYAAPIDYFSKAIQAKSIAIELHEYFPKQTIRNHCNIATADGVMKLTIPLEGRKNKSITKDIRISYAEPWQKLHFKSIETAYNNSPYFEFYNYKLEPFYKKKYEFLIDFNTELTHALLKMLKENVAISFTESYEKIAPEIDFRNSDFKQENPQTYYQIFSDKNGFIPDLSIYDLLFNSGPTKHNSPS